MDQTFSQRSAEGRDFDNWLELWAEYNAFYSRSEETALPEHVTRATWERFFRSDEPMYAIVAERGERLVGLAHYLFHRSTIQVAPTCYLQDLFTHSAVRNMGSAQP